MRLLKWIVLSFLTIFVLFVAAVAGVYWSVPQTNTALKQFDVIIVLGTVANDDGTPSPEQRERVLEGVREFRAGVAPRLLMTGGAAHNRYVEAAVMAKTAESQGVPADVIFEEGRSQNTIQNAFYSMKIMDSHGWHSAEIVSSPSHLPRASLIFRRYPIQWRMHAARWPSEYSIWHPLAIYSAEASYTSRLRLFGFRPSPFLPTEVH